MLATGLLAAWLGIAAATPPDGARCAGGDETARLWCLINEKDAVINKQDAVINKKDALIDEKDALIDAIIDEKNVLLEASKLQIEESQAKIDQQRAVIEALQAALQAKEDAAAHLVTLPRQAAGRAAQGSTAQQEEEAAAHVAALPRQKAGRDTLWSAAQEEDIAGRPAARGRPKDAAAHLAARGRPKAGRWDAQGSTAQQKEDIAAHIAARRLEHEDRRRAQEYRRRARDALRSTAQLDKDATHLATLRGRRDRDARRSMVQQDEDAAAHLTAWSRRDGHRRRGEAARRWAAQPDEDAPEWRKPRRLPTSPGRQQVEARRLPEKAGQLCTDYPLGWVGRGGYDCHVYVQGALCTPTGDYGDGWNDVRFQEFSGQPLQSFDDFAANNATALSACCGCGGGKPCTDIADWTDKNGNNCSSYTSNGYCDGDGGTGAGWPSAWGTFADQALPGQDSAATACCACRPRARDASGRGCDYYALHPAQCGCCDDEDFRAQITCSTACSTTSAVTDLTLRLAEWTNDTHMIIFPPNAVTGTIPSDWSTRFPHLQTVKLSFNSLEGTVPPELGLLPELRHLDLGSTEISGSIPAQLKLLKNLQYLYICDNSLTGTLVPGLGQLANLEILWLRQNQLTGTIPPDLGSLHNLKELKLYRNKMQGTVPVELGLLSNLQVLGLQQNQLTGTIPGNIGNLTSLQDVYLQYNMMEGTLPAELGRLRNLQVLYLYRNAFTGTIPRDIGNLTSLRELRLHSNMMSGTIPADLGRLRQLQVLKLNQNALTGAIPPDLVNLTQATLLDLQGNQLSGTIPPQLSRMENLLELWMVGNMMSGTIPAELGRLRELQILNLGSNKFTGTLPRDLGNLTSLDSLNVYGNMLEGTLPSTLGNLVQLTYLDVDTNNFHGTLPAELGALKMMQTAVFSDNMFSGTLPSELGKWEQLQTFFIDQNLFTGPVPKELGMLQQVTTLALNANMFTALPAEIGRMQALHDLDVSDNPSMTGAFPDTSGCPKLETISAYNCNFTTAGAVGAAVNVLDFRANHLTALPDSWTDLPAVTELDLSHNKISTWRPFGVLPLGTFSDGAYACGRHPLQPRLNWIEMEKVDLSGNPLGNSTTVRDFIWSFAYLRRLSHLGAAGCELRGEVPNEGSFLAPDALNTGELDCSNLPLIRNGYPALFQLDLSGNKITSIRAPPSERLSLARLSNNALSGTALNPSWYDILGNVEVFDNPLLRASVDPPKGNTGCPSAGAEGLQADGFGWTELSPGDAYQCTTLCASTHARYKNDPWLNVSSLCRCKAGREGAATNCLGCPPDTFSKAEDLWGMVRTCSPCPPLSTTDDGVENATTVDQCKCQPGWYMRMVPLDGNITQTGNASNQTDDQSLTTSNCVRCKQRQFQTTLRGATQESQCVCSLEYQGLRALLGLCGCVDGQYMDHTAKRCRDCDTSEHCTWGVSVELSLVPPVVRAGYWPEPVADDEVDSFSANIIWRCVSKETCLEGGVCADGREGRACSLCSPGTFGDPDGDCRPCPRSPEDARKMLLLGLLIGPAATLGAHILLQGSESTRQVALSLPAVRTSVKQALKYVQMLGVMSVFNVRWPSVARNFFTGVTRIVVALPQVAGIACLSDHQTASLEMGFRWLLPVAGLISAFITFLLLFPTRWLCRRRRWHDTLKMDLWDVLRVSFWGLVLFQSTLLQFGTQMLMCVPSPNGVSTVQTFPHLQCNRHDKEWVQLATISAAFLATCVAAVFVGAYAAWRRTVNTLVDTNFKIRGWWGFLFGDFRAGSMHWVMLIMAKDIGLVVIAVAGAGNGAAQLLATATGATMYSYCMLRDQPFNEASNNFLEAWTAMSLAALAIFSAGMGYQSTAEDADVPELYGLGASDSLYRSRAQAMLALQWISLAGPAGVVVYQVLTTSAWVTKRLPLSVRPMTEEERKNWNEKFLASVGFKESHAAADFLGVVESFDAIDGSQFRSLMSTSTATLGLIRSHVSGIQAVGRRRMEQAVQRSGSFRRPVTAAEGVIETQAELGLAGAKAGVGLVCLAGGSVEVQAPSGNHKHKDDEDADRVAQADMLEVDTLEANPKFVKNFKESL